jgi:small basic protein
MWVIFSSFFLGMLIGFITPLNIPVTFSKYLSVAILAGLDSSLGGMRAGFEKNFRLSIFTSGFTFNILMAVVLVYLGDLLGIDLYIAAIVVFGMRIFNNITAIRRFFIKKFWIDPKDARSKRLISSNININEKNSNIILDNEKISS